MPEDSVSRYKSPVFSLKLEECISQKYFLQKNGQILTTGNMIQYMNL